MTIHVQYPTGSDITANIRVGAATGLTQMADHGQTGQGQLIVHDTAGALSLAPLTNLKVTEPQCAFPSTFVGYSTDRVIGRIPGEDQIGASRQWTVGLIDVNGLLSGRPFQSGDVSHVGVRPAETDLQRVAWLLSASHNGYIQAFDTGYVATTGAVNMPSADYRGQYPLDVLNDCAAASSRNFFIFYDDAAGKNGLFYHANTDAIYTSTLSISNVAGDENRTTVFAPSTDAELKKDPTNLYTEALVLYSGGTARAESANPYDILRGILVPKYNTTSLAAAQARANAYLAMFSSEQDYITCTLQLPVDKVNLILPGHRVQCKFQHLPGYTSYTYVRVTGRTVSQDPSSPLLYTVKLTLSSPISNPGAGTQQPTNALNPPSNTAPFVPSPTSGYAAMLVADGATHIWPLSETSGGAIDIVSAENGTYNNLHADMTRGVAGVGSIAGGGGVQVISAGSPPSNVSIDDGGAALFGGNSDRSFEFWTKFVTCFLGSANFVYGNGLNGYNMAWSCDGTVTVAGDSGLNVSLSVSNTIGNGNYHLITFTYNGTTKTQSVYLDGAFATSAVFTNPLNTSLAAGTAGNIMKSPPSNYIQSWSSAAPVVWTPTQIANHALGDAGSSSASGTPPGVGQPVDNDPSVTSTGSGQSSFTTAYAYASNSLMVFVDGVYQQPTETNPHLGTWALSFVPRKSEVITVRYQAEG